MGWVTLALRKTELKKTKADYQKDLLDISREKRRMAREYHYQQIITQNQMSDEIDGYYDTYKTARDTAQDAMNAATENGSIVNQEAYDDAKQDIQDAQETYEREKNEAKTRWEYELQRIEEEASDTEAMLDQEQVQIETQLEAISAELEAIGDSISSEIKASTIKLT